jgi:Nucleotidyltransferase domain
MVNKDIASLYTDYRELPTDALEGQAKQKFDEYIQKLESIKGAGSDWSAQAKSLISQIILETLKSYGVDPNDVEFYICGSLAKKQATPYSDFDCICLWKDPKGDPIKQAKIEKIKQALTGMDNLFQRIFERTNQLCPDPIGISPFKCAGTPEQVLEIVQNRTRDDVDKFVVAISTAQPLLMANTDLLTELKASLKSVALSAMERYKAVVNHFPGPKSKESVNLKLDIFRPLDAMIAALRSELLGSAEVDDNPISFKKIVEKLAAQECISYEFGDFLYSIFNDAMPLRVAAHLEAHGEQDTIYLVNLSPEKQRAIRSLVDKIAILRGIAEQRLQKLETKETPPQKIEFTSIQNIPYKTKSFEREEMVLDISPYMYENPARLYFESQREIIHNNLIKANLKQEGGYEGIFNGIQNVPEHLAYLSSKLSDCFEQTNDRIRLDEKQFEEWCQVLFQNAVGGLFDFQGKLRPWITDLIVNTKPGECSLTQDQSSSSDNTIKFALLNGYFTNLTSISILNNPVIKEITESNPSFWKEINEQILETLKNKVSAHQLIEKQNQPYTIALYNLKFIIDDGIALLEKIKPNTTNKKIIVKITQRIEKYEQLKNEIDKLATDRSVTKKDSFHNAYHFFASDFEQFTKEFKNYDRSLWLRFREAFGNIRLKLRSLDPVVTFSKKIKNLDQFLKNTKHDYSIFAYAAARNSQNNQPEEPVVKPGR